MGKRRPEHSYFRAQSVQNTHSLCCSLKSLLYDGHPDFLLIRRYRPIHNEGTKSNRCGMGWRSQNTKWTLSLISMLVHLVANPSATHSTSLGCGFLVSQNVVGHNKEKKKNLSFRMPAVPPAANCSKLLGLCAQARVPAKSMLMSSSVDLDTCHSQEE